MSQFVLASIKLIHKSLRQDNWRSTGGTFGVERPSICSLCPSLCCSRRWLFVAVHAQLLPMVFFVLRWDLWLADLCPLRSQLIFALCWRMKPTPSCKMLRLSFWWSLQSSLMFIGGLKVCIACTLWVNMGWSNFSLPFKSDRWSILSTYLCIIHN